MSRRREKAPRGAMEYVGPSTRWGLQHGVRCRLVSRTTQAPGICKIATDNGRTWFVRRADVKAVVA